MVSSLAAIERLKEERPNAINNCVGTAGFSLGEITALVFAGAIDFEDGNKIASVIFSGCNFVFSLKIGSNKRRSHAISQ